MENGVVQLSDIGQIVDEAWSEVTAHRPGVMLDLWVVMPNHVHGIVVLPGSANPPGPHPMASDGPQQGSLGAVIGGFKSAASREARRGNLVPDGVLWQRGYYDRIIRNARELDAIRQYIADNPVRWADDPENPERFEPESFGSILQR
ncbi:MAG: transposase [Thermomicrobiales bacterium]